MKQLINRTLLFISVLFLAAGAAMADAPKYKISKWTPNDGGIFKSISADGKWGVINLGMSGGDTTIKCPSRIYDIDNDKDYTISLQGNTMNIHAVSNVDGNGMLTIVGDFMGRPASCQYDTNTNAMVTTSLKIYPLSTNWQSGTLTAVTPDGKYAVGTQTGYYGSGAGDSELGGDFFFNTIFADVESGSVIETPGLPTQNLFGTDEHAIRFTGITPDGRFILGEKDWFFMQPNCPLSFVYDTKDHTYTVIGFTGTPGNYKGVVEGLHHIESPILSPNGKYMTGDAYMAKKQEGSMFDNEYHTPFIYNMETGEFVNFDDADSQNIVGTAIDDNGNIYGSPENGSPLRNFKIFYKQKYWIPFTQICQQIYGFNFASRTNFEFSGTPVGVSGNGRRFVAFSDPSEAESYAFDYGASFDEIAEGIDLLSNYSVSPEAGATLSRIQTIEVNFGRSVQVLGRGNTHVHLYKGSEKVCDGLSATGESGGIAMKQNSKTTVRFSIRPRSLEDGEDYTFVIDAGAIALANDASMANREIRISYKGRKEGAVKVTASSPADGTKLSQLNSSASYIQLTFDCPVALTDKYDAYVERIEDGDNKTRIATLSLASGNTSETKNKLLMYPTSTLYLYDGVDYRVTLAPGSVSDYSGAESSYNAEWSMNIKGSYIREISSETTLFIDDFNDPNASISKWLLFEGDHNYPLSEMTAWGFDADNTPWNYSTHDTEDTADYFATSHSLYVPSGKSDDWMMTPQLLIPADGKAVVMFDAQRYRSSKEDHLKVYVIPEDKTVSYLNDNNMAILKAEAELLADIVPPVGKSENVTSGEWQHYSYSLAEYAGKNVYIAFVNDNTNQSAVFVDNVSVQQEILYIFGFSNEDRVVNKESISIAGNFTVKTKDFQSGAISLILKDGEGKELSRVEWPTVSGSIADHPIPFAFGTPLPLVAGKANKYSIDVVFDGKDGSDQAYQRTETFESAILNLAFAPTKRVVLEEMTGYTCPNCPQGFIAIEACERQYKDQFIPVSIHSYDGDTFGQQFMGYSSFLKLAGAPSARINRIAGNIANNGIYYPMWGNNTDIFYDMPEQELWFNVVGQELNKLALCDVNITANLSEDGSKINVNTDVRYALDADQPLSVYLVILEDNIVWYQENNFANTEAPGLGEWGLGGIYGSYTAYPVTHNDLVRKTVGETFAGTIGLLPQQFEAGKVYSTQLGCLTPDPLVEKENYKADLKAVIMLIDTQSGEIVNAAKAPVLPWDTGIDNIISDASANAAVYNMSGMRINGAMPAGIYIQNGKKFVVK